MKRWICAMTMIASGAWAEQGQMIETFDAGAQERWSYVADNVMGGVSTGQAQITQEGMHLTGMVSTQNNGGFIQVRRFYPDGLAADAQALVLTVRGNGARYTVFLRTEQARRPWHNYKASFETSAEWREVRLELSAFEASTTSLPAELAPEDVRSIGLAAYGADYEADLWVSELRVE
ncbi:CIA30 family protein [Planktotalea sp.]|uniref:CIA30 family protein n=1 Tax=Planktotalea sp. TaxID=2029877 RepID=UPI003299CB50